jgi:hypothetical protein
MTTTETIQATPVLRELLGRLERELPNVELDTRDAYTTVRSAGETIGYVNGKHRIRIDGPMFDGATQGFTVTGPEGVDAALAFLALQLVRVQIRAKGD